MNVNKVILIGKLGELKNRQSQAGDPITSFGLYQTKKVKGKDMEFEYSWFNCVAFKKTAEYITKYLSKGSKVYIEGTLSQNKWTDKNTNESKVTYNILVNHVLNLSPKEYDKPKDENNNLPLQNINENNQDFKDDDIPF